jgi:hypothetical protein
MKAKLMLQSWAGVQGYAVEIIDGKGTPTRHRIRFLKDVRLPGNRCKVAGETALVPKYAVKIPSQQENAE